MAENLLIKAANGDTKAFEAIIIQYEKLIYNISYRIMGNAEDAKDISQEAIIKIYKNIKNCENIEHMRAWVSKITHNCCMDELRRRKRKITDSLDAAIDSDDGEYARQITDPSGDPEEELLRKEINKHIQDGLDMLSGDRRALIVLRDIQGLSYEEISEITQTPLGTVKSRISRGRETLKRIIISKMNE